MYTVQIQRYSINTTFPAALEAKLQGFMNTTHFYLHLQQHSPKKIYDLSRKGLVEGKKNI